MLDAKATRCIAESDDLTLSHFTWPPGLPVRAFPPGFPTHCDDNNTCSERILPYYTYMYYILGH